MAEEKHTAAAPTNRWVKFVLVVSLGLNMLVVGAVGGMIYTHQDDGNPRPNLRDISYGPYARALSTEDRKAIGVALRREAGTIQQNRPKTEQMFNALFAALKADVYDRNAVHGLVQDQLDIALKRQQIGQRLLLERIDTMTPKERRKFAQRMQRALERGPWAARRDSGS